MPARDPRATERVEALASLRGVRPRLLFTPESLDRLRQNAGTDPVLRLHASRLVKQAEKPDLDRIVKMFDGPTPALVHGFDRGSRLVVAHLIKPTEVTERALTDLLRRLVETPVWDTGREVDHGMGAAAVMFLAGITFDAIADDLEPGLRRRAAAKLFEHARRMLYLGHLQRGTHRARYWQQDPQNNHRWHRNAGLIACVLAVADEPGIDAGWMLQQLREEMDFVMKWYPHEGDCHEGNEYSTFGFAHLALSASMMDRVLGTRYLEHEGLRHAWEMLVYAWSPRRDGLLGFGDSRNPRGRHFEKNAAFFVGPQRSRDPDAQAALRAWHDHTLGPDEASWMMPVFYDPSVPLGSLSNLPTHRLFADLGLVYLRGSWESGARVLMFKCGPYGGHLLNTFRETRPTRPWINVAHNDPDANSFVMTLGEGFAPHPSIYDAPKLTMNHNTILVDGKGQKGEGGDWMQPLDEDMRELAYLTGWKRSDGPGSIPAGVSGERPRVDPRVIPGAGDVVVVEGEAGNAYDGLEGFRRTLVWVPGRYVLVLDHVRADRVRSITWNAVADEAGITDKDEGRAYFESEAGERLRYQILSNRRIQPKTEPYVLRSHKKNLEVRRTAHTVRGERVQFACLLNPWDLKPLELTWAASDGPRGATLEVVGPGFRDVWEWRFATDLRTASTLVGTSNGGPLIALGPADAPPTPGE
ncbi:MAG: hypothetical protein AAFX76_02410 [Planctomycetota bacterium]